MKKKVIATHHAIGAAIKAGIESQVGETIWVIATPQPGGSDPDGWPTDRSPQCLPFWYGKTQPTHATVVRKLLAMLGPRWAGAEFTYKPCSRATKRAGTKFVYGHVLWFPSAEKSVMAVVLKLTSEHYAQMIQNGVILLDNAYQRRITASRH